MSPQSLKNILISSLCLCSILPATHGATTNYDFSPVTQCVQGWVDKGYYPGVAVLIAKNNQVVYEKCFGSYTPDTDVFIASAGKWLAAATIISLVDEGRLSLDDHPSKWLPEFKNDPKDQATLRQLLSHTSGYPPYQPKSNPVDDYQMLTESVAHLLPLPLDYQPGERFNYGGLAMQVAGRMAEAASGEDWETLFQERIAKPCGMTSTHFTPVDSGGGHSPMLGGGARSTLHDYANFLSMIFNGGTYDGKQVLSENAIREMQADQVRGATVEPDQFVEHVRGAHHNGIYGLGEWREELDATGNATLISSPSWAGAYPWIDKTIGVYGVIIAHVDGQAANKFSGFFSSPVLAMTVRNIISGPPSAMTQRHPELLVTPKDLDAMKAKLENDPWAKESFAALKAQIDPLVARCKDDPEFMSSRLFMNWQTHYITTLVRNSKSAGGEGRAPIPTPRFGGARDWATKYTIPANLADLKPYNDRNGMIWVFNKETQTNEWADPATTGRLFEIGNEQILQTAADAGFIYWVTGDETYAKYADQILMTYMNGFSYMQPPKILEGGGGEVIGFDSFEVIHEDVVTPLAESYDFIYDYMQRQGEDVQLVQNQLKRMGDRVIAGGSALGNWNLNQARIVAYAGLALEDNTNYPDGKGREYYMDVILNARLPAQTGITHVIKEGFDAATGVWPEAPGYSFGTPKDIILIASLAGNDPAGQAVLADPILKRAIIAQINLVYPNGYAVGLGDTVNPRVNTIALELLITNARQRGDTDLGDFLTAALNREITSGYYDRGSNADLVALCKYVGELKDIAGAAQKPQRTFFGTPLNVLMQRINGADAEHSLAAAMYGTAGGHVHANGLSMEIYGAGVILGADPGRGVSYWQPDHAQYYSQPPAHNTVIVNGLSDYAISRRSQIAMQLECVEPEPGDTGVSPDIGFAQASFHYLNPEADQQRTLALVKITPQAGFYFDIFRSRAADPTNSFHDYLYHNIGQSLALTDEKGIALPLASSSLLASTNGYLKGYDYFQNEKSTGFSGDFSGVFTATLPDHSIHQMHFWMLGRDNRRIFSVDAPGDHAGRDEIPSFYNLPMPTLVIRQHGDAWSKPFVTIYEPTFNSDGVSVTNVHAAKVDETVSSLVACDVEGQIGQSSTFSASLAQNDDMSSEKHFDDAHLWGSFGAILKQNGQVKELYLGHGRTIGNGQISLEATNSSWMNASLIRTADGWSYSASAPFYASLTFVLSQGGSNGQTLRLMATDSTGSHNIAVQNQEIQKINGESVLVVKCSLDAGSKIKLSLQPSAP
ncbi:MAG TPA: serine hydrolase [Verrucomicrobiae bacterium]|jgi:CubicO group peptidase (beta-lactamase class C family)